jgi:branched-subunit amino acid aminotransferase/4-amino-4-deoxychorismate lyase
MPLHWEIPADGRDAVALDDSLPAGLLFGMHVYTTLRFPLAPRWQEAHWRRLSGNARVLGLAWPFSQTAVFRGVDRLYRPEKPVLRLSAIADVSGYGDFEAEPHAPLPARLILSLRSAPASGVPFDSSSPPGGLRLGTAVYERPRPLLKLGAMPESILLKRAARRAGFDDVLFIRPDGIIREASTSNLFLIRRDRDQTGAFRLETPDPERDGCLPGIARLQVRETAQMLGVAVSDAQSLSTHRLSEADGAFLTNAAQGVRPIRSITHDGREVGFPWPLAAREWVRALGIALGESTA